MTFWNNLTTDVQLLTVIAAFLLPIAIMIGAFTWRDARRHGMKHLLWTAIAVFAPALMGFIIYLLVRSSYSHLLCTACGHSVKASAVSCPSCGAKLKPACPDCGAEIQESWQLCPKCAAPLNENQEITPAVRPRNKALWAMLAMFIIVPLVLTYFVSVYVITEPYPRYFHTRHALDTTVNESLIDPEYLKPESWFSYTLTNADGTTTVERANTDFSGGTYRITGLDGTTTWSQGVGQVYPANGPSGDVFSETNGPLGNTIYGDGSYYYDEQGRPVKISLSIGQQIPHYSSKPLYKVELTFSYDEAGNLTRQEAVRIDQHVYDDYDEWLPDETTRRYVNYTYDEMGRLTRAEEYNHTDTLTGCTEYTWALGDTVRIAQRYAPDGTAAGRSVTECNAEGNILRQEFYDETDTLAYTVEFSYDPLVYLMRPTNLAKLAIIWIGMLFFAGYIVVSSNKEYHATPAEVTQVVKKETKKEVSTMANTKQESKGKRSYAPLLYLGLYLINLVLIVLVQATFICTYDRPITKESLEALPYFSGCEVLDLSGEEGTRGPGYVLYADAEGQQHVVELDYMLFLDKFAIDERSVRQISDTAADEIEYKRLTGGTTIYVENGQLFEAGWGDDGGTDVMDYVYLAMVLLLAEGAVILVIEKVKKKK